MKLENLEIKRFTAHKIYGKSKTVSTPYADDCKDFCNLGADGLDTLHKRISSALNHKSKFFELDLDASDKKSFFEIQKHLCGSDKKSFLKISQQVADKIAEAHERANIPDGLLLLVECKIGGFDTVVCIKAEQSNAFSVTGSEMKLIKDIFLSSDKTLYKVGFFLRRDKSNSDKKSYRYFVYDDAFSPSKEDLAFYFYNKFLGLSTEGNSKLQTNKLYRTLVNFAEDHIDFSGKYELIRTIDRHFLDDRKKNLNATDFKSYFPSEVSSLFESTVEIEFPHSIVRDTSIVNGIATKRFAISDSTTLLLKNAPDGVITGSTDNKADLDKLKATLDSGAHYNYALVPTLTVKSSTS